MSVFNESSLFTNNQSEIFHETFKIVVVNIPFTVSTEEIIVMSTLYPFCFSFYCCILYLILSTPSKFRNSYYTLIVGLGISDLSALLYMLYGFVYDFVQVAYLSSTVDKILSMYLYWVCMQFSTQIYSAFIATNRFCAVTFLTKYKTVFTVKLSLILIGVNMFVSFLIVIPIQAVFGLRYQSIYKFAGVDFFNLPVSLYPELLKLHVFLQFFPAFLSSYSCILYIFSVIYSLRKYKTLPTSQKSYVKEMKLMFQGVLIAVVTIATVSIHFVNPPALLNRMTDFVYCSLNPFFYLMMDSSLRKVAKKKFTVAKHLIFRSGSSVGPTST